MSSFQYLGLQQLSEVVQTLQAEGAQLSIDTLVQSGIDKTFLERIIVIEFGGSGVFDGFFPDGYLVNGRLLPIAKLRREFH